MNRLWEWTRYRLFKSQVIQKIKHQKLINASHEEFKKMKENGLHLIIGHLSL